ncbi:MAG TPA: nitroreductase [Erysipelotrichaceae bacterium]|nr:nitroreductase [Erysipelotrichaceae bacterium]
MNTILESLYQRKSCRVFTDEPVSADLKQELILAAMQAPTAGNMHLYSIIDITDQTIKDQLAESCDHQAFIAKAPLVFVFCADYHRAWMGMKTFINQEARKPETGDMFLAMSDALICAQNMVVAAQGLGLGSCYIGDILENYEYHRDLLKLPEAVWPIGMLVLGYPTQHQLDRKKPKRFEPGFVVHSNHYASLSIEDHQAYIQDHLEEQPNSLNELNYYHDLYNRKYTADFTHEMNRSVKVMLESLSDK